MINLRQHNLNLIHFHLHLHLHQIRTQREGNPVVLDKVLINTILTLFGSVMIMIYCDEKFLTTRKYPMMCRTHQDPVNARCCHLSQKYFAIKKYCESGKKMEICFWTQLFLIVFASIDDIVCSILGIISLAKNYCGYVVSARYLMVKWVRTMFLKAQDGTSKVDNPNWW